MGRRRSGHEVNRPGFSGGSIPWDDEPMGQQSMILRALAAALALGHAALASAADAVPASVAVATTAAPARGCAPDATCPVEPVPGTVVVDLDYDGLGNTWKDRDGILRSDEIQCAIDCLDGDTEPENILPLPRSVYDAPPAISGGTLLFLPERPTPGSAPAQVPGGRLRYEIERPLVLPFSKGSIAVRGDGAILRLNAPPLYPMRAVFRRALPSSLSPRDIEFLHGFSDRWTFEGLLFVDPNPGNPGPPSIGIELQGAYHLVVERCRFDGFDRGVELHFCVFPTIRDCEFGSGHERDIIISDGVDCGSETGPCWTGKEGWLRESGSHQARLIGNHHVPHPSAKACVQVIRSMNPVFEGCVFEGPRPEHCVVITWPMHATEVTMRDTYIELSDPPKGKGLLRFECGGVARIDGFNITSAHPEDTLVDLSGAVDLKMIVSGCGWLPAGVRFDNGKNKYGNRWAFRDMVPAGGPLLAPARWVGGTERVPVNVTIDGEPPTAPKR